MTTVQERRNVRFKTDDFDDKPLDLSAIRYKHVEGVGTFFEKESDAMLTWALLEMRLGKKPTPGGWRWFSGKKQLKKATGDGYFQRVKASIPLEDFAGQFTQLHPAGSD